MAGVGYGQWKCKSYKARLLVPEARGVSVFLIRAKFELTGRLQPGLGSTIANLPYQRQTELLGRRSPVGAYPLEAALKAKKGIVPFFFLKNPGKPPHGWVLNREEKR